MLRRYVVESADDAALEDGEISFDRVGMRIAAHVFTAAVVDGFVAGEHRRKNAVLPLTVRHKAGLGGVQLRVEDRTQVRGIHGRQMERAGLPGLAVNESEHHLLAETARPGL